MNGGSFGPMPFYETSVFWERFASWSLFALFIFETLALAFEESNRIRRFVGPRRSNRVGVYCAGIGIVALGILYKADDEASKYRSIENAKLNKTVSDQTATLSEANKTISQLSDAIKVAQGTASKAERDNASLVSIEKQQAQDIDRLRNKQDGPFTWNMSFMMPSFRSEPGPPLPVPFVGSFTPDRDITITRVVAPVFGPSFVLPTNGGRGEPCSVPAYFYLGTGSPAGSLAKTTKYRLAMPNGDVPSFALDSGPISVDFPAGVQITASYQAASDATRFCFNTTNMSGVDANGNFSSAAPVLPVNITVQYVTKQKTRDPGK